MNTARLYLRYIGVSVRSQMQYRASFLMLSVSSFLVACVDIVGIWALFERFQSIRGWTLPEVGLFFGLIVTAFAVGEAFGRGFDVFDRLVRSGDFDRLLLRPRGTAFQVAAQELTLFRIGKLSQGLIVLFWASASLGVTWTAGRLLLAAAAIAGGASLFYGLFVLQWQIPPKLRPLPKDHADLTNGLDAVLPRRKSQDFHAAGLWHENAREYLDGRALARPIWPDVT